ncbi:putative B3 domain-containing protein [Raphanus sativus]|nr:putative B3 domain-containing protein [Raphanus sativus]
MTIIKAWNLAKPDPAENIPNDVADMVEQISEPIKKQVTVSDVKDDLRRLLLGKNQVKKKMRPLLTVSEIHRLTEGLDVTVYGPGNVVREMKFKMWNKGQPVLTSGWKGFVDACNLEEHCDFLHIWMFRHRETRELCFVIEKTKYSAITEPLGKKISDQIN